MEDRRLKSSKEIIVEAKALIHHLDKSYKDMRQRREWTKQAFHILKSFAESRDRGLDCSYNGHPDGKREFLWDFIAYSPETGIYLAAESEHQTRGKSQLKSLHHDFEKLLYVYAPIRLLFCKAVDEIHAREVMDSLQSYASSCCYNFNPGSIFILYFALWDKTGNRKSVAYTWQSKRGPLVAKLESMNFAKF